MDAAGPYTPLLLFEAPSENTPLFILESFTLSALRLPSLSPRKHILPDPQALFFEIT